jgi:hypothetical protein
MLARDIQQGVVNALVSSFTKWQLARQTVPLLGLDHAKEGLMEHFVWWSVVKNNV